MAQITFKKEFNFWDILVDVNIQPFEQDKYVYQVNNDIATLTIEEVSQSELEQALSSYDHQKYLDGLPKPQPSETEQIRLEMARSNAEMFEMMVSMMGGAM